MRTFSYVAAALGLTMLASEAHSAPFTTGSYYEENGHATCGSAGCRVIFTPVAGDSLLVTNVACRVEATGVLNSVELTLGLGNARSEPLPVGAATLFGGSNVHGIHEEVKFHYAPGQRPAVNVYADSGSISLQCRIVGTRPAPV